MTEIISAIEYLNETLLGFWVMIILTLCGIYLTFKSGFFQLRGIRFIFKNTIGTLFSREKKEKINGISPFQAVTTALAGTMGVGNIVGVATAIVMGGAGAIFWMWVSAFFGMATKYAEIFLAVKYRERLPGSGYKGGPMYYIQNALGNKKLAQIFAIFCALSSFGIGNMTQSNSVSSSVFNAYHIPPIVSGVFCAIVVAMVIFGGIKRIARFTEMLIPFISIIYISISTAFLFIHRADLQGTFSLIITQAFALKSASAGVLGYTISKAMRYGISRGVFTNEAGLGSAPIAHAAADCKSPAHQAVWGMFEVFLDTIVVCTITALVILCADGGKLWQSGLNGAALTSTAFESVFGLFGGKFIAISILLFAVSAMLSWCYYGEQAVGFLSGNNPFVKNAYRFIFLSCIVLGATSELNLVWAVSDTLNALTALPNIIAIIALAGMITYPTKNKSR